MADPEKKWNRFQRLSVKSGRFSERAKRAENASVKHAHRFIIERIHNAREVRRNIAIWLLGMGILVAIATAQFFLYQASYTAQTGADGGTYAEGVRGNIDTLNPLYAASAGEQSAARLMFSGLLTYDKAGKLRGDLAQNYSVLDGGKRYRVTLKPVVFWHDNKRLTADDVVFTINLIKNPATGIPSSASWQNVEVARIDDRTIDFTLPTTYAPFPKALIFPIVPKHILEKIAPGGLRDSNFSAKPIGSGPFSFRLKQSVQGNSAHTVIHMNQNTNYYASKPKLERYQLHSYDGTEDLAKALKGHAVNAVSGLSLGAYRQFIGDGDYDASVTPINAGVYSLFNTRSTSVLGDAKIRQALQIGTNVKEAVGALPVELPVLDAPILASQANVGAIKKPAYDKKKAGVLLDEAGWKRGKDGERSKDNAPLILKVVAIKDADYESVVANLAKQWRSLGARVEVRMVDTNDPAQNIANTVLQPRDFDVLVHELYLGADPDVYAYWHSSQAEERGLNFSNYSSGVSDDTLASARLRLEEDLRVAKYQTFVRQWFKDAPAIGLYQSNLTYVHTKGSMAFDPTAKFITPSDRLNDVIYWTTSQTPVYKTP